MWALQVQTHWSITFYFGSLLKSQSHTCQLSSCRLRAWRRETTSILQGPQRSRCSRIRGWPYGVFFEQSQAEDGSSFFSFWFVYVVALGLCCCTRAFSSSMRASHCGGSPCCGEQTQVRASGVAAGLSCYGWQALGHRSVVVAHGWSCSSARGLFTDQGSNPCPGPGRQILILQSRTRLD